MGLLDGGSFDLLKKISDAISSADDDSDASDYATDEIRDPWAEDSLFDDDSSNSGYDTDEIRDPWADEDDGSSVAAWASRQTTDSATQTALDCGYEIRNIILAKSIQFTRAQSHYDATNARYESTLASSPAAKKDLEAFANRIESYEIPRGLEANDRIGEWRIIDDYQAEFRNDSQRVIYRILVVEDKERFIEALKTEGAIVIYSGHARYGRGPCFGQSDAPGDDWEDGADPSKGGLFRMGYPIIAVHVSEIKEHGYEYYPVSVADFPDGVPSDLLHPETSPSLVRRIKLPDSIKGKARIEYTGGDTGGFPDHLEVFGTTAGEPCVLLWAGWTETHTRPFELDKVDLTCRCFCLFGCSTGLHFRKILREHKGWSQSGNDRWSFYTSCPSTALLMKSWLESLLNYEQDNAHQSWEKALRYAKDTANKRLAAEGANFRVVD